jgi:hypothetical protein
MKKENSKITPAQKNLLSVTETTKPETLIYLCNYLFIHTYNHFFINHSFIQPFITFYVSRFIYSLILFIYWFYSSKPHFIKQQPTKYGRHETKKGIWSLVRHTLTQDTSKWKSKENDVWAELRFVFWLNSRFVRVTAIDTYMTGWWLSSMCTWGTTCWRIENPNYWGL